MSNTVIIHISNDDPIVGELDELPGPSDTLIIVNSPRRRDGKDVQYLANDVIKVVWPLSQISFIEIMPSEGEERIIGFVRE
jgi:hypothetical protein